MNDITLTGYTGQAPKVITLPTGRKKAYFSFATTDRWTNRETGEKQAKTQWHRIIAFGDKVDTIEKHFSKGKHLMIKGSLQYRETIDAAGIKRTVAEVVLDSFEFLDRAPKTEATPGDMAEE